LNLPLFYRVHSPFYSPRGVLTVCGTPTGGPGQQELFYERYGGHLLELLSVVLSAEKLMCVSTARIWPCTALSCTVSGASVTQQQSRAVTVGTGPSVRGRDGAVPWRALLQRTSWLAYYRPSSHAQRRDGTAHSPCTVRGDTTRRLGNRRAYRGVSIPAPCASGRPLFLTWARPAQLPH
jgi:hypothetical protein